MENNVKPSTPEDTGQRKSKASYVVASGRRKYKGLDGTEVISKKFESVFHMNELFSKMIEQTMISSI